MRDRLHRLHNKESNQNLDSSYLGSIFKSGWFWFVVLVFCCLIPGFFLFQIVGSNDLSLGYSKSDIGHAKDYLWPVITLF